MLSAVPVYLFCAVLLSRGNRCPRSFAKRARVYVRICPNESPLAVKRGVSNLVAELGVHGASHVVDCYIADLYCPLVFEITHVSVPPGVESLVRDVFRIVDPTRTASAAWFLQSRCRAASARCDPTVAVSVPSSK